MNPVTKNQKVKTEIIDAATAQLRRDQMFQLYSQYYTVCPKSFFARFESNDCYALYTCNGQLVGFTGFRIKEVKTESGTFQTLYIGQTVMTQNFRGQSMIPRTCCTLLFKLFLKNPFRPVHIWCDALTYKPYLLFANSVKRFYPSRQEATTPKIKALLEHLGHHYYGERYDATNGTVRKPANVIADPSTLISAQDRLNKDIDFYAKANPGYEQGNGLLLITPIDFSNFCFLIKKCLKKMAGFQTKGKRAIHRPKPALV